MSGHTPGPWAVGEDGDVIWGARWKGAITHVATVPFSKDPRVSADARLIAAAPDLLELAECVVSENPDYGYMHGLAVAAIAKATGASP